MCYDIRIKLESALRRAQRFGDTNLITELEEKLRPYRDQEIFHATGFAHPNLLIYTNEDPYQPVWAQWGLVPHWVKDAKQKNQFWNKTLNARGETIFEKPAFRKAAREGRGLVYLDGFFEHHHQGGETYPFYIQRNDGEPFALACLYSDWTDPETGEVLRTFAIVTTTGNKLLTKIHNNPKMTGPRMPLILPEELEDAWLQEIHDELDIKTIHELIQPFPDEELTAYPVRKLRGKDAVGNTPEAVEPYAYPELEVEGSGS